MATEICITIEDDGTFTVEAEEAQEEAQEEQSEDTGSEQKCKTWEEAIAVAAKLKDAATMAPPPVEQEGMPAEEEVLDPAKAQQDETTAMEQSFRPGITGR